METFASPPRRTIYTVIFRGEGGCKPEPSPDRNRRNGEKAGKINTCVSRRGFKKFISPVEKLENRPTLETLSGFRLHLPCRIFFAGRETGEPPFHASSSICVICSCVAFEALILDSRSAQPPFQPKGVASFDDFCNFPYNQSHD